MNSKRAFTLIELLVVIAIIALLVSILMPALNLAKQQATAAVCMTNQKTLAQAWVMYNGDNDDSIVGGFTSSTSAPYYSWVSFPQYENGTYAGGRTSHLVDKLRGIRKGLLYKYTESTEVYHCPGDLRQREHWWGGYRSYSIPNCMHGTNDPMWTTNIGSTKVITKYNQIPNPASKYVFVEEADNRGYNMGTWVMYLNQDQFIDPLAIWHHDRGTLGFADGHAIIHSWADKDTMEFFDIGSPYSHFPAGNPDVRYMQLGWTMRKN